MLLEYAEVQTNFGKMSRFERKNGLRALDRMGFPWYSF